MYKGYKVKALVFAGRRDTMSILFPKIKSDILDEVLIGINTRNQDDIAFIDSYLPNDNKFKKLNIPNHLIGQQSAYFYMFSLLTDEDTIYIKLDDDLIWFSENFFEELVKYRLEHPEYYIIYPFVLNKPLCNYLGKFFDESKFRNKNDYMFQTWKNPIYSGILLSAFGENKLDLSHIQNYEFDQADSFRSPYICPSINCICFFGKDCKNMNWSAEMRRYGGDEGFITVGIFNKFGNQRKHIVYANCKCVHYAFFTQREFLNSKIILKYYR